MAEETPRRSQRGAQAAAPRRTQRAAGAGNGAAGSRTLELPSAVIVHQLAEALNAEPVDVIKQLMRAGVMVTINQVIDFKTAAAVAVSMGYEAKLQEMSPSATEEAPEEPVSEEDPSQLQPRAPVITILGHVDHGKTSLLDVIRQSNVVAKEAGGITQHIGAYQVEYKENRLTFLDTPGHEAFTAMRARGAQATDIAVLVVAADDGIMPQTVEAINHAKAANVPIVVALNKVDRPDADADRVKRQLSELNLLPEEWGGDVIVVPTSATVGTGIEDLLENLLAMAEVMEFKANPLRPAHGVAIEARLDKNRGPTATILVQDGTLHVGDSVVAGDTWGRIKAMISGGGVRVQEAGPAVPVEILGLESLPQAGDLLEALSDERSAKALVEERRRQQETQRMASPSFSLEEVSTRIQSGELKELLLILKCDVQGSIDAVKNALSKISSDKTQIQVVHAAAGTVTESDVLLASASKAIIVGFTTRVEPGARHLADQQKVEIRLYDIIYRLTEDMEKALQGLLEPVEREVVEGHAQVRAIFSLGRRRRVAGCQVTDGVLRRNATVRVIRNGAVIHNGAISSLKRFKDDAREVSTGFECGVGLEGFTDIEENDILEGYRIERSV